MAKQVTYTFEDDDQALRFVRICGLAHAGFAYFRYENRVSIIDPTNSWEQEILQIARELGGKIA